MAPMLGAGRQGEGAGLGGGRGPGEANVVSPPPPSASRSQGSPCPLYPNEGSCPPRLLPSHLPPSPSSLYPGAWSSGLPLFPVSLGQLRPPTPTLCPHSCKWQSVSRDKGVGGWGWESSVGHKGHWSLRGLQERRGRLGLEPGQEPTQR